MKLTSERMPMIKYVNVFTLEEIAEANLVRLYTFPNQDYVELRKSYEDLFRANGQSLTSSKRNGFPGAFGSYLNTFTTYYDQNLCTYYSSDSSAETKCTALADSLLTKGLTLATTTMILNSDSVIGAFFNSLTANSISVNDPYYLSPYQNASIISDDFQESDQILDMILPPLEKLKADFEVAFQDYLNSQETIEIIKFVLFLVFCFLVFFFLWQPYLKNLKDKIFRTKGMLNMIPMDIISKNESLRALFLSGNILQAVK